MRITITRTCGQDSKEEMLLPVEVSVEHVCDDLSAKELIVLISRGMLAYGFRQDEVNGMLSSILDKGKDQLHLAN